MTGRRPPRPAALLIDLDGTLLDPHDHISTRVAEAVARAARVLPVALASGRVCEEVAHFARLLGLDGPQVSDNGSRLVDALSGRTISDVPMPADQARRIMSRLEADGMSYIAVDSGRTVRRINDVKDWRVTVITGQMSGQEETVTRAAEDSGDSVTAIPSMGSRGEWYLNYIRSGSNKGTGATAFCRLAGVDPADAMCIGDGLNDLEMFDAVGIPVAMAGADPSVLERAAFITASLAEDGVSQAIERWVL